MWFPNKWISVALILHLWQFIWCEKGRPNIILIMADDLGWNDVGFHGSSQIPTPNIDALAYHGTILNRHYVLPTCAPSRASLMTGKYAIKTGLQGVPGPSAEPRALPIDEKILPQYLKELGYKTHLIGKWHLGFSQRKYTPTQRGFDTHFGYYNGWVRYNDSVCISTPFTGIDARRNLKPAGEEVKGKYLTTVYTDEAVKIIKNHNPNRPLFLDISHVAVHAVKNDILQVANKTENDRKFHYIKDDYRRLFAGVLDSLDKSVGQVIEALDEANLLENSIIIFMADNGGPTRDPKAKFRNTSSNWPLRGMKTSFFDGGVRGATAIWSPLLKNKNTVSNELFHISDWLPTLVAAAGGTINYSTDLDGVNQWTYLTGEKSRSNRDEILVNIDHIKGIYGIIWKNWKLLHCNESYTAPFADDYDGIPGREDGDIAYSMDAVLRSKASQSLAKHTPPPAEDIRHHFNVTRQSATIDDACKKRTSAGGEARAPLCRGDRLYNIEKDPCEYENVEAQAPAVVKLLRARLEFFESLTMKMQKFPTDPRADPSRFGGYWSWWLDLDAVPNLGGAAVTSGLAIVTAIALLFKTIRIDPLANGGIAKYYR